MTFFGGSGTARVVASDNDVVRSASVVRIGSGLASLKLSGGEVHFESDAVSVADGITPGDIIIADLYAIGDGGADSLVDFDAVSSGTTITYLHLTGIVSRSATAALLNVPDGHAITRLRHGVDDIPDHSAAIADTGMGIVTTISITEA